MHRLHRRTFLKAAGITVALPALDSMRQRTQAAAIGAANGTAPKRMIVICTTLGLHAPSFFPTNPGATTN